MQSNTGSEEHLETPILQYAGGVIAAKLDRTEKNWSTGFLSIFLAGRAWLSLARPGPARR